MAYRVSYLGQPIIFKTLDEALNQVRGIFEVWEDEHDTGTPPGGFDAADVIELGWVDMRPEEVDALPEFEGY